ncbi:MAG TPA: hypothetical protein VFC18_17170 [Burkholderiales bacterium]|nr:hypothetical protein [Burkholderiales bacterium]
MDRFRNLWAALILVVCVTASPALAFEISYTFALLQGKELELCRHMLRTYKDGFARPWVEHAPINDEHKTEAFWETQFARYPSSPEFDAIRWKAHTYKVANTSRSRSALFAEFDIDNDGSKDLVVRVGFFTGSPGSWDYLWIFDPGGVQFNEFHTHADFLKRIAPSRRAVIGYPLHQRPFIYKGRTYLHGYVYTPREFPGSNPAEPFGAPEYFLINEYVGGPARDGDEQQRHRSMKLLCKYELIQDR